ncbi:MAG: hypothetical protein HZA83_02155 [Thaumarchaeota archaeon]|nr:hypothetical protein [Nitrososphaerota archaeon]
MKFALALGVIILISSVFVNAYAQEEFTMKQTTPNGKVQVELFWPEIKYDEIRQFSVTFRDPSTAEPLNNVAFDLRITQGQDLIEDYHDEVANGVMVLEVLFNNSGPATVDVNVKGVDAKAINEKVTFSVTVVPEFPLMMAAITAVSMALVIAARFNSKKMRPFYSHFSG